MKILHITNTIAGGAGKAALRLHRGLRSIGVASKMLVLHGQNIDQEDEITIFNQNRNIFGQSFNKARQILTEFDLNKYKHRNAGLGTLEVFTDDRSIYKISGHPLVKEADIITLHWIAEMVDYNEFFSHVHKPIVWSLSDMNPVTGGCHYSGSCVKYESGCGSCPQLCSNDPYDLSRRIFLRKAKAYKGHDISIVSPSNWFAERIKRNLLFRHMNLEVIPIGVPITVFIPRDKKFSRRLLMLPQDKMIILFGSQDESRRKGLHCLTKALKLLQHTTYASKVALALCGHHGHITAEDIKIPIYDLGYIHGETLISCAYSAADLFVMPSAEESFGQMCLEAMACGTPVIGSNVGGILDLIIPGETGLLTYPEDAEELAQKIAWMVNSPQNCFTMGQNARKHIETSFTVSIEAERYLNLYGRILGKGS